MAAAWQHHAGLVRDHIPPMMRMGSGKRGRWYQLTASIRGAMYLWFPLSHPARMRQGRRPGPASILSPGDPAMSAERSLSADPSRRLLLTVVNLHCQAYCATTTFPIDRAPASSMPRRRRHYCQMPLRDHIAVIAIGVPV